MSISLLKKKLKNESYEIQSFYDDDGLCIPHLCSIFMNNLTIEVTEDYEGNPYHVAVFDTSQSPPTHEDTKGCKNPDEVFEYLKELERDYF